VEEKRRGGKSKLGLKTLALKRGLGKRKGLKQKKGLCVGKDERQKEFDKRQGVSVLCERTKTVGKLEKVQT